MDERSKAKFAAICAKDISGLTEADKSFIRARQYYLGKQGRAKFAEVLKGRDVPAEPVEVERADWSEHPADTEEQTESVEEVSNDQEINSEDTEDDEAEG